MTNTNIAKQATKQHMQNINEMHTYNKTHTKQCKTCQTQTQQQKSKTGIEKTKHTYLKETRQQIKTCKTGKAQIQQTKA